MRIIVTLLLTVLLMQQVFNAVSASAEQHSDGLYYLVITGDAAEISHICSFGNCGQGAGSRLDALNYFGQLLGQAKGIQIVPIPPPLHS